MRSLLVICLVGVVVAPPPQRMKPVQPVETNTEQAGNTQNHQQQAPHPGQAADPTPRPMYEFAYSKYLEEVVKILESDPKFAQKLKEMPEADIKAGMIADHIDDLDDVVYGKLHKAKLEEIERLRAQIEKQIEADGGAHNVKMPDHIDVQQWDKFGREDLRKLIVKTVAEMTVMDQERRQDFKSYEMQKKAEEDHKLAQMNEEERKRALQEEEERQRRHNEHEKLKHPGGKDQLEEVWEEGDKMDKDSYDPRTFFALHDINGDGFWNMEELEALFQIELEKMYNETNPDDDPRERYEEMHRMREHVTNQMDKNKDRLISLDEFLQDTEAQQPANEDRGWKDLGEQQVYTDEELRQFEEEYAKQQNWGDHAYDPSTAQPDQPHVEQQQQQQQQHVPVANAAPPANQEAQAPAQPAEHIAQPAETNQQPIQHEPIVDPPKDPSYGI